MVATSGNQLDLSVIFIEGEIPNLSLGNMIVSVASDSGGGINPRCGSRTKRAIYDLNGPVHLMGWKKDSFGPNDYRGTATLKVTSGST